jgi:hypothetical protein
VGSAVPVPPGVVVPDASCVEAGGVSVGNDRPGRVGGRVDVMKIGAVETGVSSDTVMHEPRLRLSRVTKIQIFFIERFYCAKIRKLKCIVPAFQHIFGAEMSGRFMFMS